MRGSLYITTAFFAVLFLPQPSAFALNELAGFLNTYDVNENRFGGSFVVNGNSLEPGQRVDCPPEATIESEPCGDDTNGGCNMTLPAFESIQDGETICGTAWWDGSVRDTDWYEIVTSETSAFTWTVESDFDATIGFVMMGTPGSGDCEDVLYLNYKALVAAGEEETIFVPMMPPGTHWFFVAPDFNGSPFGCTDPNEYVATLNVLSEILTPFEENMEVMMDSIGSTASLIARVAGVDENSPLSFVTTTDTPGNSFTYSLLPGSTYMGQSLTLEGTGTYNPPTERWDLTLTGLYGSEPISGSGYVETESGGGRIGWIIKIVEWAWDFLQRLDSHSKKEWIAPGSGFPRQAFSVIWTIFTLDDEEIGRKKKDDDDGEARPGNGTSIWDWNWQQTSLDIGPFALLAEGTIDEDTGAGTATVQVTLPWPEEWSDNFDDYPEGPLAGQGGWEPWGGEPNAADFMVTSDQSLTEPHSLAIDDADDAVQQFIDCDQPDVYHFSTWQYIPETACCEQTALVLLNSYDGGGPDTNWSTLIWFDPDAGLVISDGGGTTLPLIKGEWVEIWVAINLEADFQSIWYGRDHLATISWTDGYTGNGALNVAAVDLWANSSSYEVYYDDMMLRGPAPEATPCPADLTGDGQVNIDDIFAVLGLWGDCTDPCPPYCEGDITEDCTVNIDDIFAILGMWGPCE